MSSTGRMVHDSVKDAKLGQAASLLAGPPTPGRPRDPEAFALTYTVVTPPARASSSMTSRTSTCSDVN